MSNSKPWDIIGWGIIGYVVLVVLVIVIAVIWIFGKAWWDTRRVRRAHAGKLKCQTEGCTKKAAYRTPVGYFCLEDSKENSESRSLYARVSFRMPLNYMKAPRR